MTKARIILRDMESSSTGALERKLSALELAWDNAFVRKFLLFLALAAIWELYGRWLDNSLLFPPLSETMRSLFDHIEDGSIPARAWASVKVLVMGYAAGVLLAGALTIL